MQDTVAYITPSTYDELVNHVKQAYEDFLREVCPELRGEVSFIVAPGVGSFKNTVLEGGRERKLRFRFKGMLHDFYSYVLARISKEVVKAYGTNGHDGSVELHLDLTHGINYMPTLTYRAAREVANILSWSRKVKLIVYNSEPYTQGITEYRIHTVEDSKMLPVAYNRAITSPLKPMKTLTDNVNEAKEISNEVRELVKKVNVDELNAFIGSIANGLPLTLYTLYPNAKTLEDVLNNLLHLYKKYTIVKALNDAIIVEHRVAFREHFNILTTAWLLASTLRNHVSRKDTVSMEDVKRITKEILSKNERLESMISRDIYEIKSKTTEYVKKVRGDFGWTPLYALFTEEYGRDAAELEKECSLNKLRQGGMERFRRNFLAHSGFEKCVTLIKHEEGETYFRYLSEAKDLILEAAARGLLKTQ